MKLVIGGMIVTALALIIARESIHIWSDWRVFRATPPSERLS